MKTTTIALSSAALAGALLLAPTAVFAGSPPPTYSPIGDAKTVGISEAGVLNFSGFPGNTGVTGTSPDGVSLAVFRAATLGKTTSGTGTVSFTAASSTPGVYTINVVTNEAPVVGTTGTLTVLPAGGLTGTGSELPTLALWGAGAALALGAAGIATVAVRRSRRA